ncbi:pyridoxine 5'-phosphate synthase [Luteolibacter sp. AS25]|uniref:pyridoxine 5'-phosphate synthase n=1 Tax=Luteolibacter sp. AS25 TaxID=3135776 RepID=UPI00398AB2BD
MSLLLGVNIDHVATLRQARYALLPESPNAEPSVVSAALEAKAGGADSITVHVRGDRRHMQDADVFRVKEECDLPLNLELGITEEMMDLAFRLKPDFACLVPETREEVTTEGGLDVVALSGTVREAVKRLKGRGIKVSLFVDPVLEHIEEAARLDADMIELHTGAFANAEDPSEEISRLIAAAKLGKERGLQVNAGHGINYRNLPLLFDVPHLTELNIGHSIVSRAITVGMRQAVSEMLEGMKAYPAGE